MSGDLPSPLDRAVSIGGISALLLLCGCGSLVDGSYVGEPLMTITGQVRVDEIDPQVEVGVALLWSWGDLIDLSTQQVSVETSFPARYRIDVFRAPPEETLAPFLGIDDVNASVGDIVLFEDLDGNGLWDFDREALIGGAFEESVLWIEPEEGRDDWLADPWQDNADSIDDPDWLNLPGFHLVEREAPFSCLEPSQNWLFLAPDSQADLEVGYFFPAGFDWDCDGSSDEEFWEECDQIEVDMCAVVQDALMVGTTEPEFQLEVLATLVFDDIFRECTETACGEAVDALVEQVCQPADAPDELCGEF